MPSPKDTEKRKLWLKRQSESHRGQVAWNIGLTKEIDEGVEKISNALKGRHLSEKTKQKLRKIFKGSHHTEKTKLKISKTSEGKHYSPRTEFKKGDKRRFTKEFIKKILGRRIPTSLEEKFQGIVRKYKLPYKYVGNGSFTVGNYNPDFVNINGEKIAIEVYARFYKRLDGRNIEKWKEKRTRIFRKFGWNIIYFDETEVNKDNVLKRLGVENEDKIAS